MSIKLIAIDMDGTLLNEKKEVSKEDAEAIQAAKEAGIQVVLCTGRPFPGVINYLEEIGLNETEDYAITYNGALVQNTETREIVADYTMDHKDYLVLEKASSEAGSHFHALYNEGIFTPNKDISLYTVREAFLGNMPLFYRAPDEMDDSISYNKMMMVDDEAVLEKAISQLSKQLWDDYTVLRSEPYFLEFLNKKANKGNAVALLADKLGIAQEETMAIGDSGNDTHMIEFAGIGVAMENAIQEVKDSADVQTHSNSENGVAHAIYTYVL